jgi:hypothetical protein
MKKIWAIFLVFFLNLLVTNFAIAAAAPQIYISRISANDDNEFIEIYNPGDEFEFSSLKLFAGSNLLAEINNKSFLDGGYILIRGDKDGVEKNDADYKYRWINNFQISKTPILRLEVDSITIETVCTAASGCVRIPTLDKDVVIRNTEFAKNGLDFQDSKYSFLPNEQLSTPKSGGLKDKIETSAPPSDENPNIEDNSTEQPPIQPEENVEEAEEENPIQRLNNCQDLKITEILANSDQQFIEIANLSSEEKTLAGCLVRSSVTSSKDFHFTDQNIAGSGYFKLDVSQTDLKIYKSAKTKIEILDQNQQIIDSVELEKTAKNSSWAFFEDENLWRQTYQITAEQPNVWLEFLPCEEGKIRNQNGNCVKIQDESAPKTCDEGYFLNEATGRCNKIQIKEDKICGEGYYLNLSTNRCRKIIVEEEITPCKDGYYRNPETGRCRKIASLVSATLVQCKEGYYRNPETNRCRKIASAQTELAPCKEGYERNLETNRCRKIVKNTGASDAVEGSAKQTEKTSEFVGWWVISAIGLIFSGILIWEFRRSLVRFWRKVKEKDE